MIILTSLLICLSLITWLHWMTSWSSYWQACQYTSIWSHEVLYKILILIEVDFRSFLIFSFFIVLKQHCFLFLIFSLIVVLKQQLFLLLTCCFQNCMKWEWSEKVFSVWSKRFVMIVMKYTRIAWLIRFCCSWTTYISEAFSFRSFIVLR